MQSFLPYPSFIDSAKCLDYRRLGKQRVECLQILKTLKIGPYQYICHICNANWMSHYPNCGCNSSNFQTRKTPWYNHPAVQQWKNYELSLIDYTLACCEEWINRGYKDTCKNKVLSLLTNFYNQKDATIPPWLGLEKFHLSHKSALLFKNFDYYKKYNWNEKPELNYYWPSKIMNTNINK